MDLRRLLLLSLPAVLLTSAASAQNWPQFRGSSGDGLATGSNHPDHWSAEEHVAWKTPLAGVGWSQPIVWNNKVFVTFAAAEGAKRPRPGDWSPGEGGILAALFGGYKKPPDIEYKFQLLCLDLATGKTLWEQTAHTGKPRTKIHPNNSYATETPATDGEHVIAYFGMTGLYCYDLEGKLQWQKDLGSYPTQMDWGSASSPVIYDNLVYIQCDNDKSSFLAALDKKSGDEVWRAARSERSNWCTPLLWKNSQRTELVAGGGASMRSYDPATGKVLWEMAASGRCSSSPVAEGDLLFVNSGDRLTGQRGLLAAIKPGGSGDISLLGDAMSSEHVAWAVDLTGHRVASPAVALGCLYLLEQQAGILRCVDAQTGKQHYRQRLAGATGLTASPWVKGDKVYCLDQSGQTFVLQAGPDYKVLATNKLADEMFWASPAIAGNSLLLRGVDHLFCLR
jgi:outer membrane protein assembly factor BamB